MNPAAPIWLTIAAKYLGVRETKGPATLPVISGWRAALKGWWRTFFTNDDQPWCALFVNECLKEVGIDGPGTMRASDFATWGVHVGRPQLPPLGAILVFERPGGGHVGFYLGESPEAYRVRGGNQGDAVSDIWIPKARLTACRWPAGVAILAPRGVLIAQNGAPVSKDEA